MHEYGDYCRFTVLVVVGGVFFFLEAGFVTGSAHARAQHAARSSAGGHFVFLQWQEGGKRGDGRRTTHSKVFVCSHDRGALIETGKVRCV